MRLPSTSTPLILPCCPPPRHSHFSWVRACEAAPSAGSPAPRMEDVVNLPHPRPFGVSTRGDPARWESGGHRLNVFAREISAGQRDTGVRSSGSKRSALIAESTLTEPGDISSSHCVGRKQRRSPHYRSHVRLDRR